MTHEPVPETSKDAGEPLKSDGGESGRRAPEVGADRIDGQALIDSATAPTIPMRETDNNHVGHAASNKATEQTLRPGVPVPSAGSYRLSLSLPNVAGGKPYEASTRACLKSPPIAGLEANRYKLTILSIDGLAETGLHHDIDGDFIRIHGTTTLAGDHRLRVFFRVGHPDLPSIDGHDDLTLTVNPDPRSLWKDIEPDPKLPFQKPHTASQRLLTPDASLVAASRRGRSHAHEGSFRDDDFALGYDEASGWHYMVVADGAGSAKLSRRGSKVACDAVREPLLAQFSSSLGADFTAAVRRYGLNSDMASGQIIRTALYNTLGAAALVARKAVEGEASANANKLRDYSTTLLLSVCRRFDVGYL
jgi:Protein phosphatase 2C